MRMIQDFVPLDDNMMQKTRCLFRTARICGSAYAGLLILLVTCINADATIFLTEAKIAAGRLVVSGTSDQGETVSLDGHYVTGVTNKAFIFSLVYVPTSCVVSLGAPGTTTPSVRAAIANCAPMPVKAMGAWQAATVYQANDLVERQGGNYVALNTPRPNVNEDPLFAVSFWRAIPLPTATADQTIIIGAKGERGEAGRDGVKGEDGALSNMLLHTIKVELSSSPVGNGVPNQEWTIASSGSLTVTMSKDSRDGDIDLFVPTTGIADHDSCILTATSFDADADSQPTRIGQLRKRADQLIIPVRVAGSSAHIEALLLCPKAK